ncbi:DUF6515 family protein [Luteolibacter sp. LG18]|uniref:DUF6515 family protein n=1 Tax=Luteolibacter sp. LG18 TaxID=2819286 RepID=UPI002B2D9BA4|nr:hypothetical protein llg_39390 [Luteolibacter sp. LG18]
MNKIVSLAALTGFGGLMLTSCIVDPAPPQRVVYRDYRPGYVVETLPGGYQTEVVGGVQYYHHDNIYYRPQGRGYVVVESPRMHGPMMPPPGHMGFGTTVTTLPNGARIVTHNRTRYWVHDNVYYQSRGDGYVIVRSPFL